MSTRESRFRFNIALNRALALTLALLLALTMVVSANSSAYASKTTDGSAPDGSDQTQLSTQAATPTWSEALRGSLFWNYNKIVNPTYGNEWTVFTLARVDSSRVFGEASWNDWAYYKYMNNLNADPNFADKTGPIILGSPTPTPTDNARMVLALTALGWDASRWQGRDLVSPLTDVAAVEGQGTNAIYFALLALDSRAYLPENTAVRGTYIDDLINSQEPGGGWDPWGFGLDADGTAQAVQALMPYSSYNVGQAPIPVGAATSTTADIDQAIAAALTALSSLQGPSGAVESWGSVSANSTAQVIIALATLNINPTTDARFVKDEKSLIDGLLSLYNPETGAFQQANFSTGALEDDGFATIDGAQALIAYSRQISGLSPLFDLSSPDPDPVTKILAGANRQETAAQIALEAYPKGAKGVIIANGEGQGQTGKFPDALAASSLAGLLDYPILLATQNTLPTSTAKVLDAFVAGPTTLTQIIILGDANTISSSLQSALASKYAVPVERLSGTNRIETAVAIYNFGKNLNGGWAKTAIFADAGNFPDALAIAPYAANKHAPIFLVQGDSLSKAVADVFTVPNFSDAILVGSQKSVSSKIATQIKDIIGKDATRLAGDNRYATAFAIAVFSAANGLSYNNAGIATGENFPDALTGGPLLGKKGAVILLAKDADTTTILLLSGKIEVFKLHVLGGENSVSAKVRGTAAKNLGWKYEVLPL